MVRTSASGSTPWPKRHYVIIKCKEVLITEPCHQVICSRDCCAVLTQKETETSTDLSISVNLQPLEIKWNNNKKKKC